MTDEDDVVIRLSAVSKRFRIGHGASLLGSALLRTLGGRREGSADVARDFWALRDVDFTIRRGESVGVVGRNGAGKSTLLALLANTTRPSSGTVEVRGRVAPMLELGAGFHPDLTGYENVHLNAMLLGLDKAEIAARLDAILEYSELGEFIREPLRTYSTGMRARLGFSVIAHVDPDIVILDEVLGVGDARFQEKCRQTLDAMLESGKTMLFVSHQFQSIRRLCDRAIWLEHGRVSADGAVDDVISRYREHTQPQAG